jgi:uncharacterized protein (DUF58 family)
MTHPYIKVFEEERELTVMLLIDVSQSSYLGTKKMMKNQLITEISAVLSFSAITNNDKVGVLLFSDKVEKFIPPQKGRSHILRIISELLEFEPKGNGTSISGALEFFSNVIKKRSTAFLFSDFMSSDYEKPLRIATKKHDIIGIHIYDELDTELPNVGLLRMYDAETGEQLWVDTSNKNIRTQYKKKYTQNLEYFTNTFLKTGADTISISSLKPYVAELHNFFRKRAARR